MPRLSNFKSNVTYESLIASAAKSLHTRLENESVPIGIYRENKATITIAKDSIYGDTISGRRTHEKTVELKDVEERVEDYVTPSEEQIKSDITEFMKAISIPVSNVVPTGDGAVSFFYALNYFVEKAVMKKIKTAEDGNVTYHLHYKVPDASSYNKIPYSYKELNVISSNKVENIYNQVKKTCMLSDEVRETQIKTSTHTSSSSSSSCSSSSCSSSSCSSSSSSSSSSSLFIAYFNLA